MNVTVCATWYASWKDHGCTVLRYDVPDKYGRDEKSVRALFEKTAREYAEQTDDDYAKYQIECGFDWGVFADCVDQEFLARYNLRPVDSVDSLVLHVDFGECLA